MPPSVACALVETSTGKPQAVRLQLRVEVVEHQAGLDRRGAIRSASTSRTRAQVLAVVDDQRGAGRLAALAGAGAARQHRHVQVARDVDGDGDVARRVRGTNTPTGMTW